MTHYVCKGTCGGVNDAPNVCHMEDCPKNGEPMEPCDCTDGMHGKEESGEKMEM